MYIRKYTDLHLFIAKYSHLQGFLRVGTIKKRENPQKTRTIAIKKCKRKSVYFLLYLLLYLYTYLSMEYLESLYSFYLHTLAAAGLVITIYNLHTYVNGFDECLRLF